MAEGPGLKERAETAVRVGLERIGLQRIDSEPADMEPEFMALYRRCEPFTMTTVERMYALWKAVQHVSRNGVQGDFVECGVWRGGSSMLASLAFRELGEERRFFLYDTYEGMPEPSAADGKIARYEWKRHQREDHNAWCYGPLDEVRANMLATGLPKERFRLVRGKVEDTLPGEAPERIAILRLDTDWYESTRHELVHLYPRLEPGGVLIVDDYGHWEGARKAVDEYLREEGISPMLTRVDYSCRVALKLP